MLPNQYLESICPEFPAENSNFKNPLHIYYIFNNLSPSLFHSVLKNLFASPAEKSFSLPADQDALKTLSSAPVESLPEKRPPETEESFKNSVYRKEAFDTGLTKKKYELKPNADVNLGTWEEILAASEKAFFPYYVGLHPVARDIAFARVWAEQFLRHTKHRENCGVVILARNPTASGMKRYKSWQCWRRARIWADFKGAKYEDWCLAIFKHYQKHPPRGTRTVTPQLFAGPMARDIYEKHWDEVARMDLLKRSEIEKLDPDFLPENYKGTEMQNRYFASVLTEIKRLADALGQHVEKILTRYVEERIMAREFAESPLNTVCPGFKYEAKTGSWLDDIIKNGKRLPERSVPCHSF
ncbi:MAG: hypothetical protein ABSF90_30735 [Syntrophobacteraceae bacterium]